METLHFDGDKKRIMHSIFVVMCVGKSFLRRHRHRPTNAFASHKHAIILSEKLFSNMHSFEFIFAFFVYSLSRGCADVFFVICFISAMFCLALALRYSLPLFYHNRLRCDMNIYDVQQIQSKAKVSCINERVTTFNCFIVASFALTIVHFAVTESIRAIEMIGFLIVLNNQWKLRGRKMLQNDITIIE